MDKPRNLSNEERERHSEVKRYVAVLHGIPMALMLAALVFSILSVQRDYPNVARATYGPATDRTFGFDSFDVSTPLYFSRGAYPELPFAFNNSRHLWYTTEVTPGSALAPMTSFYMSSWKPNVLVLVTVLISLLFDMFGIMAFLYKAGEDAQFKGETVAHRVYDAIVQSTSDFGVNPVNLAHTTFVDSLLVFIILTTFGVRNLWILLSAIVMFIGVNIVYGTFSHSIIAGRKDDDGQSGQYMPVNGKRGDQDDIDRIKDFHTSHSSIMLIFIVAASMLLSALVISFASSGSNTNNAAMPDKLSSLHSGGEVVLRTLSMIWILVWLGGTAFRAVLTNVLMHAEKSDKRRVTLEHVYAAVLRIMTAVTFFFFAFYICGMGQDTDNYASWAGVGDYPLY